MFKVRWIGDTPTLTYQAGVTAGDTFYITAGGVGVESVEGVVYAPGRALPYIELSGGIRSDGSYASRPFSVFREEGHFVLPVQAPARPENIVGWDTYTTLAADRWMEEEKPYVNPAFQLADLGEVLPMNRTYLSHFIKAEYGCTFYQFVNHYRVEEAKHLKLANPDMKMDELATRCGFSSRTVFSNVFTREEGVSPREWFKKCNPA